MKLRKVVVFNIFYHISYYKIRESLIAKENVHDKLSKIKIQNIMFKIIIILFLKV